MLLRDFLLTLFDDLVNELDDLAGLGADHVIVMVVAGHLEHRVTTFEVVAQNQASRFELSQHPVDRRQAHVIALLQQFFVHVLGTEVMLFGSFQDIEDFHSRQSNFQTDFA